MPLPVPVRFARRSRRQRLRVRVATTYGSWFTLDVSDGGFCAELMRVLPVGGQLKGLIHLNGRDAPFTGRVAWAKAGDSRLNERGRMGVCFVQIDLGLSRGLAAAGEQPTASI